MALVNKPAPKFTTAAVVNGKDIVNDFSLEQYIGNKYVVLYFYPKDFSAVCPSELIAFQDKLEEFEKRDTVVVACSTDSEETHQVWLNTPRDKNGIEGITYPIVADLSKAISTNYEVLGGEYDYTEDGELQFNGAPIALRGTFIINKEGIIKHVSVNDFPIGRNINDVLRNVDAIQLLEINGELCMANWEKA